MAFRKREIVGLKLNWSVLIKYDRSILRITQPKMTNKWSQDIVVQTLSQQIAATEEGKRLLQQEDAILDVTELICEIMAETGVSRSELARRLRTTRGYVTQLLDGRANMTIRKVADIFFALKSKIRFSCERAEEYSNYASRISWKIPDNIEHSIAPGGEMGLKEFLDSPECHLYLSC
jgi:transcriptional regulator with XRE-family HTH domain